MTKQSFKERLSSREATFGCWITLGHPAIAEILCQAGYDWLCVDMEHSAITLHQAQQLIQVIDLAGVVPLVRVGSNDPNEIKRVMDAGAVGVIVPMVNDADQARAAVAAVKYPPVGKRGVGLARAQRYGFGFEEYEPWNQDQSVVIVQIEHIDAVNNIEDIMSVPGVDGFLIGPYDLSGSLGMPGRFEEPIVEEALERVERAAAENDWLAGFHVVPTEFEPVANKLERGYRLIAHSLDSLWLGTGARDSVARFADARVKQEGKR
jgi:2-keto-3-deoxy-L-rhamnonate aldolase RhmA